MRRLARGVIAPLAVLLVAAGARAGDGSTASFGDVDGAPSSTSTGAPTAADGAASTAPVGASGAPGATPSAERKPRKKYELPPGLRGIIERDEAQKLPDPTQEQLDVLKLLQAEAEQYAADARDYRHTLTLVVRSHYEGRRHRVLGALDGEIDIAKANLDEARDEAIRRLEHFVATYSGADADPHATPDAMFRLAALYEERARGNFDTDLTTGLNPAIDLYLRIIREYPSYEQIAGVYYFLGHAYTDAARLDEGQQAWRALVCHDHFTVRDETSRPFAIQVERLPQDHDQRYWDEWFNRHPIPLDQLPGGAEPLPDDVSVAREELRFEDPYPETCVPVPQEVPPGEEPKYLAEIWWQIGNFHFDQIDMSGGPYELNRAERAYAQSLEYKKPPLYGVAMYKRAWTLFKQQRYRAATQNFVDLLHYADAEQERTGDPGADFRGEAATYIAASLTYVDFDGPTADLPNIPRSDVLDVETNPIIAEQEMAVAMARVQDPAIIPQDEKWTVEIYKALAREYLEITQIRNAIAMFELTLERFPLDRDAPMMQDRVAELYDQLGRLAPEGSAVKEEYAAKALGARTRLADYVGKSAWTEANRDNPQALATAEELVRNGLKRAAADHTNFARGFVNHANEVSDEEGQRRLIEQAIAEYRLAEIGWAAYLEQDAAAVDAYDTRFWLADARYWVVVLQVALGRRPVEADVQRALLAAGEVRDSNEDDRYLQPAAYYAVSIAEKVLESLYRLNDESGGLEGIERRTEVSFVEDGSERRPEALAIPAPVADAILARDEYNERVSVFRDPEQNGYRYAFQAAEYYFVYGQFEEAEARYAPLMEAYCGVNEWGYKAWEKLISMSNFMGDAARSRELVEGKSCAMDEETRRAEEAIREPVIQGVAYLDARAMYDAAQAMPEGPERDAKWREAAASYKVALDAAPDRDEAPEAAMNGAYAYKQVGEYDKAIEMYSLFIDRYGSEEKLDTLVHGDPKAEPPVEPNPQQLEQRVKFLKMAYDALASAYVLFFDYPKAASTFDHISKNEHFDAGERRAAAKQALGLYVSLGDEHGMEAARQRFFELGATPEERAEADYTVASLELNRWDQYSPNEGANREARTRAEAAMRRFYEANKGAPAAAKYAVRAAYWAAKTRAAASMRADDWWKQTMAAFERYAAAAPRDGKGVSDAVGSAEAGMAAEGAFLMLDDEIHERFDYDSGHHHYKGTPLEVLKKYQSEAVVAKDYYDRLQRLVDTYASPEWAAAAIARQGSLYDSLRTGLYDTRPPALVMFDKKTERLLKMAEESDNMDLQEKADAVRMSVETAWRDKRDQELDSADRIMVDRYANAVMLVRRYNVSNPAITRAIQRLAFFTELLGEAKIAGYTTNVRDLNYSPGLFLRIRPGLVEAPKPDGTAPPAPGPVAP